MAPRIVVCILIFFATPVSAQQWPTFRGDSARSGVAPASINARRLALAWTWESEVRPDPAWDGPARWDAYNDIRDLPAMRQYDACFHPVSDGQTLYFGSSSQDALFALNLEDGAQKWTFTAGGPIRLAPTLDGKRILFGSDDGFVYCLNRASGKLLWKLNPSATKSAEQRLLINNDRLIRYYPIRTGVAVRDGVAYFGASFLPWRESYICAVDVETGEIDPDKGHYIRRHEKVTLEGNLLIAENRLIVPQGRVSPILFDRTNGASLGSLPGGGGVSIVLTEQGDVVRAEGGRASRTGQVGVFRGKERVATFPRGRSMVVDGDFFYVIDGQKLFAAERATQSLKWTREVDEPLEIVKSGDTIFVGGRDHLTAVDADSGDVVWSANATGRVFGLAVTGGRIVASTDEGAVHVFADTAESDWASATTAEQAWESPRVARVRQRSLLHRWVFHRSAMNSPGRKKVSGTDLSGISVKDQAGRLPLKLSGSAKSVRVGDGSSVEAIGMSGAYFPVAIEEMKSRLPLETISVEAWVRVDKPQEWGGIVGCIQDDGSTEHGWLLGFRNRKFCFALAGGGKGLTYLTAPQEFETGTWNHLVGTYNGREMRLYVNGSLAIAGTSESGPISYAGEEHFTVGAYKDGNETYPLNGALHEVRIYSTPMDATMISKHHQAHAKQFPEPPAAEGEDLPRFVAWGPVARYIRPGQVEVTYGTVEDVPSVVDLITEDRVRTYASPERTDRHKVILDKLPYRRELQFRIRKQLEEDAEHSESFALDTHFDWTEEVSDRASEILEHTANANGLIVVVGIQNVDRAQQLAKQSLHGVILVLKDEKMAQMIRDQYQSDPEVVYGRNLSVTTAPIRQLPAAFASVVVATEDGKWTRRLVRPEGGALHDGNSLTWKRAGIPGSGVWSHMYGQADNSAFGGESLSDASEREDLLTQWIGRPGPRYQTDRQNRKPSPLAAGGRLFLQGQQRMLALDSFSGSVLWSVETPTVMRWNVPHDSSNWCADENGVFVAAENQVWFFEGASGEITRRYELPRDESSDSGTSWGYLSRYENQLLGTSVAPDAIYTKWWGKTQWFDSTGGDDTHVVAGDQFFSIDVETGETQWAYDGLILHPTITIMDGAVYFVEDKTPAHQAADRRRISLDKGQQHELVCLDVTSGEKRWSQPLPSFAGHLACLYLAGGGHPDQRTLVMVASESTRKEFLVSAFSPVDGTTAWSRTVEWESNHHGKHISRPAIQGELLYLRPEVIELTGGETITRGFPGGHGCSSYTLSTHGMFSRLGETTWWDPRTEKVNRFERIRTDCWISVVPAQGMLLSAEGGGGCSCGSWMETSLGFLPRSIDNLDLQSDKDQQKDE